MKLILKYPNEWYIFMDIFECMIRNPLHCVLLLSALMSFIPVYAEPAESRWHAGKYSMFIHFGLYSGYGGVYDGKPVNQGYSEQIQSFAGIFSDWYGESSETFDPVSFNADSIASLAVEAGMRSIVFTSKHHDGFCMFGTETTDFNSVDATPAGRDYVEELSRACRKAGLGFGLYFSLIDWHSPYGSPISSHNADFATPELHRLNIAQVGELLTKYGEITELWFDMGSLTPSQSRELYELVHRLQPGCMVSGRLGNDMYDFAVMADNVSPDTALQTPWQSAASMFPETWGYRSWQERGDVRDKVAEKLRSLLQIVSHGGNYLLNIGPDDKGAVIPFEKEVLKGMGRWLALNGDAVYGTEASPFREDFEWGCVTRKGGRLNLLLTGKYPEDGTVRLYMPGYRLLSSHPGQASQKGDIVTVNVGMQPQKHNIEVVRLDFDKNVEPVAHKFVKLKDNTVLSSENAVKDYSYSCFDYYTNYKSTVAHTWYIDGPLKGLDMVYTESEEGMPLDVEIDGVSYKVSLGCAASFADSSLPVRTVDAGPLYWKKVPGGTFASGTLLPVEADGNDGWTECDSTGFRCVSSPFSSYLLMQDVVVDEDCTLLFEAGAGNGIEVFLNGRMIVKHLNPYRSIYHKEILALDLTKGVNRLAVRSYNRFEKTAESSLRVLEDGLLYRTSVVPEPLRGRKHKITVRREDAASPHSDAGLHNLRIVLY